MFNGKNAFEGRNGELQDRSRPASFVHRLSAAVRRLLHSRIRTRTAESNATAALPRDPHALVRKLLHQLSPYDLPVGVYLAAGDGRFLECDPEAREILALPVQGPLDCAIVDFYRDPSERAGFLQRLEEAEAEGRCSVSQLVHLRVDGRDTFVHESIRALRDPDSAQVAGYVGCLVDVTEQQRYDRLFDHLPAGVYRLDAEDRLVYANDAFVRILGYESREEIEGRSAREFYAVPGEADDFRDLVAQRGSVIQQVRQLVKRDGELFFASISSAAVVGPNDHYDGREGTLVDVTREERYRRSLNDVPVGFYEVRIENGGDIICQCNRRFVEMFDFESEDEVIGLDILELYARPDDYNLFMDAMRSHDTQDRALLGYPLRVKTHKGREFVIEVNSRLLKDRHGNITGRTGVIRNISDEHRLREEMRTLQSDIGRVLHAYTSTLLMARHAVAVVIGSMGPAPWKHRRIPSPDEVDAALAGPAARLAASLGGLIEVVESDWRKRGLSQEHWIGLSRLFTQLQSCRDVVSIAEFRHHTLRRIARTALETCSDIKKGVLPREQVKGLVRDAMELERIACLGILRRVEAEIVAMDHQVRTLRDYVTSGARVEEAEDVVQLWDLVGQAMINLEEFAHGKGVEFRPRDDSRSAHVKVVERDVLRALSSLLHNAIKYSWSRERGESPWVTISARVEGNRVLVEFENYGVPIPADEIKKGLIFRLGYRGRLSADRGRLGTGIGLTDARNVAKQHEGDVIIESYPASPDAPAHDYTVPFLTTATLILPVHSTYTRRVA